MKNTLRSSVLLVVLAGLLLRGVCLPFPVEAASEKPVVVSFNYPMKYFSERIAGSFVAVELPVPTDGDPAYWRPLPEEIAALQSADLLVLNGASYEQWLKTVSLPRSRQLDSAKKLTERLIALEGSMTHSHGAEGEHEHTGTAFTTWLDLSLAVEQTRAIMEGLSKKWPKQAAQFETNFKKLEQDLLALDAALQDVVAQAPDTLVVFSHPVYQYFEQRYGVNGKSVHWEPDAMPDEAMWQEFETLLQEYPARWMIWEDEPLPEIVEQLKDAGLDSVVFDPCGNVPEQGDFLSVMQQNISNLKTVFIE